jgi:8-oxo-dGTP pyrophosphatase MutT (NUDIX family)
MRTIHRDIVGIVIYSKDQKILLGKKDNKSVYAGCWAIPGGGIEEGETKIQATIRETLEETGLDISRYKLFLLDDEMAGESEKILRDTGEKVIAKMKFSTYGVKIDDKLAKDIIVSSNEEFLEFMWADIANIKNLKLTPPLAAIFKKLKYL